MATISFLALPCSSEKIEEILEMTIDKVPFSSVFSNAMHYPAAVILAVVYRLFMESVHNLEQYREFLTSDTLISDIASVDFMSFTEHNAVFSTACEFLFSIQTEPLNQLILLYASLLYRINAGRLYGVKLILHEILSVRSIISYEAEELLNRIISLECWDENDIDQLNEYRSGTIFIKH